MSEAIEKIEHHTQKQKESLMQTIGTRLWMGLDELMQTIGVGNTKKSKNIDNSYQITSDLEKYEQKFSHKRKTKTS